MSNDQCGYTHHASRYPESGALTCWRPTHKDHEHCIWHVDEVAKSPVALEKAQPSAGERLDGAVLRGVLMQGQNWLQEVTLIGADFESANLEGATFQGADLRGANFDAAHAKGAIFDETNLEDATFDRTKPQEASFKNSYLNDAQISENRISRQTYFDEVTIYEEKLLETDDQDEQEAYFDAATWVYRQIETVSQRNALFQDAENYFSREKDLRRRFAWHQGNYLHALQDEVSRWLMGYGRNPWQIIAISGVVIGLCAFLFPFVGALQDTAPQESITYSLEFPPEQSVAQLIMIFGKSVYFSVVTFSTLGYGDIQPVGAAARALAGIETLIGFGLVALLISVLLRRGSWL